MEAVSHSVESKAKLFIELLQKLSLLEMEIHSRGELTFREIILLLRDFYLFFDSTNVKSDMPAEANMIESTHTRMVALLSLWASCEDIELSLEDMSELILFKEMFSSIFYCSGFRGFSHLKTYLTEKMPNGSFVIPQNKLIIYFIFTHIDDIDADYFSLAEKMPPAIFAILMLGWLNNSVVLTNQGENNRNALYQHSDLLTRINPNQEFMSCVINAWMYCSYSSSPLKRDFKRNINKMIVNFHQINKLSALAVKQKEKRQKPLMLVLHERAGRNHAMFRCYLPFFDTLGEYFELYSMAEQDLTDEVSKAIFPTHKVIENVMDLKSIVNLINTIKPDIIYYPSVGMSHWTIYLANLRLAPMQIMTSGHPESSFADSMDFIYYGPVLAGIDSITSENVLQTKNCRFLSYMHSDFSDDLKKSGKNEDAVHIAINCHAMKLSDKFIDCLKKLKSEFGSSIKLHFFPSGSGLFNDGFKIKLNKILPDSAVYRSLPYKDFMRLVARCHLSLSPFPFGNTNSTVDALTLGLPVVALKGGELCSYTDYLVMDSFGLADEFVCTSYEDYLEKARRLISDKNYYYDCVEKLRSADIVSSLNNRSNKKHEFGEFVFKVFNKLNMYKSKKYKIITWDENVVL